MQHENNMYKEKQTYDKKQEYNKEIHHDSKTKINDSECSGYLVFQVYAAKGALPISNAKVTLFKQIDSNIYFYEELLTDISGKTEPTCVFAPPISLSLTPENPLPYYSYQAKIEADGFNSVTLDDIRAFRGITSIQPVPLTPTITSI